MIIWINGSFGSGKTSVSLELNKRLVHSHIFDPEEVGFMIRDNIPANIGKDDFQDHFLWRKFNYELLKFMEQEYDGVIIVPMTIYNKDYFNEIIGRLKEEQVDVKHFTLITCEETLIKRLNNRGDHGNEWVHSRVKTCVKAFSDEFFEGRIDTDVYGVEDIVEHIMNECRN